MLETVRIISKRVQHFYRPWESGCGSKDHNYGAPPPPTPPASPPAIVKVNGHLDIDVSCNTVVVTTPTIVPTQLPTPTAANTDDSVTRCICDFQHDDGYMICCDECGVWQHVDCMGVDRDNIPEIYHCDHCQPRKLDKQRAVQLQRKRRALLRKLDSSATETEDETKHNGVLQQKKVKKKKKKSRKENKDGVPGMGGKRAQWGGNRKHSPPSAHHPQMKFGRKVQPQHNGVVSGGIQNKPKKLDQNRHAIRKLNKAKMPKITSKALNMSCEDTHGPWDIGLLDSYEEAKGNQYSIDIKSLLANQPLNGQRMNSASGAGTKQLQLPDQLCRVAQVTPNHKGLEILDSVRSNQPLIEYKGKVMLREQYDKENIFFKRLHPFVLFYSKFEDLHLCVDASVYANDARYVRRSCTPNAQVQHVWENDRVHFYIYASKHIAKGSEVTIPFDFNYEECCYGVECACTKTSCPVLRLQKKVSDGHPVAKPARRRKRSSSGTDNGVSGGPTTPQTPHTPQSPHEPLPHRNSSNDDIDRLMTLSTVAAAAATVATPVTKRRKLAPLRISGTVNKPNEEHMKKEVTSPVDTKPPEQPPAAPPPTPTSAPINSPTLPAAPVNEPVESPVKTEPATDGPGDDDEDPVDNTETDNAGSTQAEKDHKMTREERKMEAILKAFERLEKREERRKEALARLEHSRKSKEAHPVEAPPAETKEVQGKDTDSDNKPEKTKPKGKKRRPSGTPARRRSRPSSSVSTATESATSADECSSLPPNTPIEHSPGSSTPSSAAVIDHAFKFPKTKKHLMSEWLNENESAVARLACHAKIEPLEINTSTGGDATVEFVKCIPSPQAHSFSRLRRSSISAGASKAPTGSNAGNTPGGAGLQLDCSIGSAKKRWLRQAMSENSDCDMTPTPTSGCDTTDAGCDMANSGYMSPLSCSRGGAGGASPNPCAGGAASPGSSPPVDFVTPLKKRRLARESLESPFPFASAMAAVPAAAVGDSQGDSSSNTSEAQKGSCEAAPLPAEHHYGATSPFRDSCQPSRASPDVSSGDNLFEKFGVPSQQRAAVVAPPDSPTVNRVPERVPTPKSEPSDRIDSAVSAVQYTNADSTELTSVTVTRPCSTPSQSTPDSVDGGATVASTGTAAAACQGSTSSQSNSVETSTDVVDQCTSCSEVDTKCTSTEPTVSSRNSCDEAVSTAAVLSSCHSECDSTAAAASRDSVTVATSCSSTSRDVAEGRTACVAGTQAASSHDSNCCVAISGSRTCVTANVDVVIVVTTATAGCSVTDSQAVVSVACSQNDSVGTSSTTVSCGAPAVAAESSSGVDCAFRTAVASCSSCNNSSPVLDGCVDAASVESGSSGVAEAPSCTPQQCSVIDSGGDSDLHLSVFIADSSLEESQRHGQTDRTDDSPVVCSVSEQPTISCSGTRDNDDIGGSSEAGQAGDNASDDPEIEKEEGEITDDDDGCGSVTGTAEEESRAIVNSICRRARELREAEISSSRHYYVKRSRSQSSFSDGHADSSSVSGTSSTPALVHGDAHHRDLQSPTHPPFRWDSPVDSTSPNQHFDLSRTVNSDATSSTQGDSYRDSYVDNSRSPASSSGDASNSSFFSSCGASEMSGPSSTCTFFGMDLPTKKKVSLSEYRKRIKQQKVTVPPRGASSNGSSSHLTSSPLIGRDSSVQPRLAPLPMFNSFRSPELGNGLLSPPLPPPPPPSEPYPDSEEAGAQWGASLSAAAVEKTREQTTSLSLTERLRREFGLDTTSESDEDTTNKSPHQTSPVPPPPPPPPQIHAAPYYHHQAPVTMAMPPGVTTTLPPQHLQSIYPTAINVSYGYTVVPVNGQVAPMNSQVAPMNSQVAPMNSQVAVPLNSQVAPLNGQVAPQQHMAYHSDSRQHAPPLVTGPVQQMAAPPQTALMPQATGQPMAPVVPIQHIVQQVAPPSHPPVTQQAAPIPPPGVAVAPQPAMAYPLDPRLQYVRAEQAPVAPPIAQTPAASYPMQQQQPPQQPLLPTPAAVVAPQRPPPGPPPGQPRSIPSLMSLPSFPTKTFSSSLLTGVDHGSSSGSSTSSGSGGLTPQSNTHPGYTHPPHSSSSGTHPSPGPPSQSGFSQ